MFFPANPAHWAVPSAHYEFVSIPLYIWSYHDLTAYVACKCDDFIGHKGIIVVSLSCSWVEFSFNGAVILPRIQPSGIIDKVLSTFRAKRNKLSQDTVNFYSNKQSKFSILKLFLFWAAASEGTGGDEVL